MRGWSHDEEDIEPSIRLRCASGRCGWCWSIEGEHASQWAAIGSIAAKIGCTAETLRKLGAAGRARPGPAGRPDDATSGSGSRRWSGRIRELRQANEILRKASAYFAQAELDRRSKP